jgi:hypothetical protein
MTARRNGTRAGCADGRVRICVTLTEETFLALRERASGRAHTLSGEAALLIEERLTDAQERAT